ncbi:MAG: PAS domain S-box protein [Bdellovibrionaceae bacterium]|nr:PAS domain S-box protein [Pseudobdellovibrionaceae bacterium]
MNKNTEKRFPIVCIGASAGGIHSLKVFFDNLSNDTRLGYVVIIHLDPEQASSLPEILAQHTNMPVQIMKDKLTIEPNHVYVASPGNAFRLVNGKIQSETYIRTRRPTVIDKFLVSLALDIKEDAVGIIFSGFGADGTQGLKNIHAEGGLCFAETAESAQYPEMPNSAKNSGCVDFEGSAKGLALKIIEIAPKITNRRIHETTTSEKETLNRIFRLLNKRCHINFEYYKDSTIKRRIQRRITLKRLVSLEAYLAYLSNHPEEQDILCDELLIKVTEFYRDKESFEFLSKNIFPKIIANAKKDKPIRFWVPGCSTGEEPYSLAIAWMECLEKLDKNIELQIFATDVSEKAIEIARRAIYSKEIEDVFSKELLQKYFKKLNEGYQLDRVIRDRCVFAVHNLLSDPPFSQVDLVSCRNTLIYFSRFLQKKIIPSFHFALKPEGLLWLGSSETIGNFNELFELVSNKAKVYSKIFGTTSKNYSQLFEFNFSPTLSVASQLSKRFNIIDEERIIKQANRLIISKLGPAGWVVNQDFQIIHIVGKTAPYVSPHMGAPSHHLFKTVCMELHTPIRQGIESVKVNKCSFTKSGFSIQSNGDSRNIQLQIHPLHLDTTKASYFLIAIQTMRDNEVENDNSIALNLKDLKTKSDHSNTEVRYLRQELENAQLQMQTALESQEAINEELRAANEELLSNNEEYQSTNEELQTAKEELQSTNEELNTLNEEMLIRNEDLGILKDDLENFIESASIPVLMLTRDLRLRRFTATSNEVFYIASTDTTRSLNDLKSKFQLPELNELILKVIDSLQAIERDIQVENGKWYLLKIRPYKSGENKIAGAILTFSDITDRKESEIMFQDIVATVREPLLVLDKKLIIKNANESFYSFFKVNENETLGSEFCELGNHQWDLPELGKALVKILTEHKNIIDFDVEHTFESVGKKTMRLNACQLDGKDLILIAFEDITEKNKSINLMEASGRIFRLLFQNAPIGITMIGPENEFIGVNEAFCQLLGYSEAELLGLTFLDISFEDDRERNLQLKEKLFLGEIFSFKIEKRYLKKDGSAIWVKLTASVIKNELGNVERSIEFIEDISLSKEIYEANTLAKESAEKASKAKTNFLATMSHEIRTPLSVISGFSELLVEKLKKFNDEQMIDFAQRILNNSEFLRYLVEDLLDLSRIEAGKINIEKNNFILLEVLNEVIRIMKKQCEEKGIVLNLKLEGKIPKRIFTDPLRLRQILINIIGNAIKFTDNGGVNVIIKCLPSNNGNSNLIMFIITDTGIGITKEQQLNLFKTFSQGDSSIVRKFGGTGLGLVLSKKIATELGGDVVLSYSKPGAGSEFVVTISAGILSIETQFLKPKDIDDLENYRAEKKQIPSITLFGMKILLAEDSEEMRLLIATTLGAIGGAELDYAENGKIAVEKGTAKKYDLILMDIMMPVMDGYEATKELKKLGIKTPIIALSAHSLKSEIDKALEVGCDDYITKPVEINKLINIVRKYKKND